MYFDTTYPVFLLESLVLLDITFIPLPQDEAEGFKIHKDLGFSSLSA